MSGDAAGGAPHSPQSCGCEGRPGSTDLLTVSLKNLLDELVHHLRQVLKRPDGGGEEVVRHAVTVPQSGWAL